MSMFDDIVLVCSEVDDSWLMESIRAADRLDERCRQYEALAPDWADAPDWAQWCVIHANGLQYWYDTEPSASNGVIGWNWRGWQNDFYRELTLPLGIDWRLCKWQRL